MTDAQWERLSSLLPPQRPRTGRPARDHRTILSAILWVLRTGAPWRDLPERFGPWATAWSRFRRWATAGVWARVLEALQRDAEGAGRLDWGTHYVDGTIVRAHQHAAGAVGGQEHEALGRSRGGFSTKVHLRAEGWGKPLAVALSGGERHESRYVEALLAAGRVRRRARGRPRGRSRRLVGDRGYSYPTVRRLLARRHIAAVIPRRRDQRPETPRPATRRRAPRPVRSPSVPGAQQGGATGQPPQAAPARRDTLREARPALPRDAHARRGAALAVAVVAQTRDGAVPVFYGRVYFPGISAAMGRGTGSPSSPGTRTRASGA